jgi:DNA-binding NarL/FixJ family response regulator
MRGLLFDTRIMQKLNLHNTAEIVLYAVRKKIIS